MNNPSDGTVGQVHSQGLSRRTFLEATTGLFAAYSGSALKAQPVEGGVAPAEGTPRKIDTPLCVLRLEPKTGNLIGITWKEPELEIIREPRLGENFRLLLTDSQYEANYFLSKEQRVSRIEKRPDGVTCHYDSLRNERGEVNVKVRYHIRAVEGRIEFSIEVENPTDLPVAEVLYGIVGGQNGLRSRHDTESLVPGLFTNLSPNLFRDFSGGSYGGGNLGIRHSAQGFIYTGFGMTMGWTEFYNPKANLGLYYANHDPEPRLAAIYYELRPFTKTAVIGDSRGRARCHAGAGPGKFNRQATRPSHN